jgi:hypothetical protein
MLKGNIQFITGFAVGLPAQILIDGTGNVGSSAVHQTRDIAGTEG